MKDAHRAGWPATLVTAAGLLLSIPSCVDEADPCGSWTYANGTCQPPADAATDLASPSNDGGAGDDDGSGLGAACKTSTQCVGTADYCAYNPMTDVGTCTFKNCHPQGSDCPTGYTCLDAPTVYPGMGLPTMCVPQ